MCVCVCPPQTTCPYTFERLLWIWLERCVLIKIMATKCAVKLCTFRRARVYSICSTQELGTIILTARRASCIFVTFSAT